MLSSLLYIVSFVLLNLCIFLVPRCNGKINLICWFPINIMLGLMLQGIIVAVFVLINIDISIFYVSIAELTISIFIFIYIKKNSFQNYYIDKFLILPFLILALSGVLIMLVRFGVNLLPSFASVDGSHHMGFAYKVLLNNHVANNMLLPSCAEGLFMQAFSSFFDMFYSYKVFLICETIFFILSGWIFLSISSLLIDLSKRVVAVLVFTIFYNFGYPLYSFIFGFSYLGFSISCISVVLFLFICPYNNKIDNKFFLVSLNIALASVGLSYTLFVPIIYISAFIFILFKHKATNKIFSFKTIFVQLKTFIFPCLVTILVSLKVGNDLTNVNGIRGLSVDGACFNDLYSSMIILLPLTLFTCIEFFKHKKYDHPLFWFFNVSIFFALILFIMFVFNKVSVYYYSKIDSLLWLILCCMNIYALNLLTKKAFNLVTSIIVTLILILGLTWTQFDDRLKARNYRAVQYKIENFVGVHALNRLFIFQKWETGEQWLDLYKFVYQNSDYVSDDVIFLGSEYNIDWSITSMIDNRFQDKHYNEVKGFIKPNTKYFVCDKANVQDINEVLRLGDLVKENDVGIVVQVKH